jgi:alanine racemase
MSPGGEAPNRLRPTFASVDLQAISQNVRALKMLASTPHFCAVVKADGYGHGSVQSARAALHGGATMLAVALVEEAVVLRSKGITQPILVLSELPDGAESLAVTHQLITTVYSEEVIDRLSAAAGVAGVTQRVHIKIDTGMNRVGCHPDQAVGLARRVVAAPNLLLDGTFTHLAVADAPELAYTGEQLDRFDQSLAAMRAGGVDPGITHASNSAGTIAHPRARYDMVRCGIAIYGHAPDLGLDPFAYGVDLTPAIRVVSHVSHVKVVPAGARASYGLAYSYNVESVVATVPIGYADGLPRRWSGVGGEVLVGGRRRTIGGRVTMDQIVIDCGPATDPASMVARGDEVVLIGRQGDAEVTAWELAGRLDTIAYEITCGLTARLPRVYIDAQGRVASEASPMGPSYSVTQND